MCLTTFPTRLLHLCLSATQEGFWSWLSGVTDNSIYPVMLADNLRLFFPALNGGWPR
jgi:hypothetical protein